jgi:hypothetical protein
VKDSEQMMTIDRLRSFPTVQRWVDAVNGMYHLSDTEWADRFEILGRFCSDLEVDPDRMITDSLRSRDVKNEYMRRLKRFVRERYSDSRAAHDAENVVRSFFIHNGARVFVRPYSPS